MKKILRREELTDKVCVIIGTRPGIIKMAPVYHACIEQGLDAILIHTGQHYSYEMDRAIMNDCGLPEPDHQIRLSQNDRTHAGQTAKMMIGTEEIFLSTRPRVVLVCGDANTNFASAVSARKLHLTLGHVEAGLRSRDWMMPEEHNRVMIDHISDLLFAPTQECVENLKSENVTGVVYNVGNTIVDATLTAKKKSLNKENDLLGRFGLTSKNYVLFTAHREENVDCFERSKLMIDFLRSVRKITNLPLVYPMHPRSKMRMKEYDLLGVLGRLVYIIEPLSYLDFISLENNAVAILTDSGGVQEEACILGIPCFTIRENTERWETVNIGANHICGFDSNKFQMAFKEMDQCVWDNPYGDGESSKKIAKITKVIITNK